MNAPELKKLFIDFFQSKGCVEIPSASIVPENDTSTLFISAGIQPLVPFFLGNKHPSGPRLTNVQKCVRTGDINEVGDTTHHTFFEMLGNWSLGDYFKTKMIPWSFEFLTKILQIPIEKISVTVFAGDDDAPRDQETADLWIKEGILPNHIAYLPKENNWWGPPGVTGPCGTDTEMFYWTGGNPAPQTFDPNDSRWVEIWNDVLIQYFKNSEGKFEKLIQNNIDTGMGVERTLAVLNGLSDNYLTAIWQPIINRIEQLSAQKYADNPQPFRIIADHVRTAVFMIADGVEPSNKEAGYVLRRVLRRAITQADFKLNIKNNFCQEIALTALDNQQNYAGTYPELNQNKEKILSTIEAEENKYRKIISYIFNRDFTKKTIGVANDQGILYGKDAFNLYQSFGIPKEALIELCQESGIKFDEEGFDLENRNHQEQSRTLSAGKFKSGLADHSEIITKYHTATHLLHAALRQVLGDSVQQAGSNITQDRLRFDFTFSDKVSPDQLIEVTKLVNQVIAQKLPVTVATLPYTEAVKKGALAFFGAKYPEIVTMYTVGSDADFFSREVCTGPHVANTAELGHFEITKEESAGSGKRRIYAVLS